MRLGKGGRIEISDSKLEVYRRCTAQFWFSYLEKPIKEPRRPVLEFGRMVHSMFEAFFRRANPRAKMYSSAYHFANKFRGQWTGIDRMPKDPLKAVKRGPLVFRDRDYIDRATGELRRRSEKAYYFGVGMEACRFFFEANRDVPPSHVMTELEFFIDLEDPWPVDPANPDVLTINGKIDRVELVGSSVPPIYQRDADGEVVTGPDGQPVHDYGALGQALAQATDGVLLCVDYKTGEYAPSPDALTGDHQFTMYDIALSHLFPNVPERRFAVYHVESRQHIPLSRAATDRDDLLRKIFSSVRAMKEERYSFLGDQYVCKTCPYLAPCGSLQDWLREHQADPTSVMRRAVPLMESSARTRPRHFAWKDGRITWADTEYLLGRSSMPDARVFERPPRAIRPPAGGKRAQQLSLLESDDAAA